MITRQVRRQVIVRKVPVWLISTVNETLCNWRLTSVDMLKEYIPERWRVLLTFEVLGWGDWWNSRSSYVPRGTKMKRIRLYSRMGCINAVKLLWLLLWSKPVKEREK